MAKIRYDFKYDNYEASASFEVDTEFFTEEMALATLTFFSWDYDKKANPIDEVMKKYAMQAIILATKNNHNTFGVTLDFENEEGFGKVDGSIGLMLLNVEGYEFDEHYLQREITTHKE